MATTWKCKTIVLQGSAAELLWDLWNEIHCWQAHKQVLHINKMMITDARISHVSPTWYQFNILTNRLIFGILYSLKKPLHCNNSSTFSLFCVMFWYTLMIGLVHSFTIYACMNFIYYIWFNIVIMLSVLVFWTDAQQVYHQPVSNHLACFYKCAIYQFLFFSPHLFI